MSVHVCSLPQSPLKLERVSLPVRLVRASKTDFWDNDTSAYHVHVSQMLDFARCIRSCSLFLLYTSSTHAYFYPDLF